MKRTLQLTTLLVALLITSQATAWVINSPQGQWPVTWPKELEPFREVSQTLDIATGMQEHIYTIPFENREQFEKLYPILISLRTPHSPMKLAKVGEPEPGWGNFLSNDKPCIRIRGPIRLQRVEPTKTSPNLPWSEKDLAGPQGELPEYITSTKTADGQKQWQSVDLKADRKNIRGFLYRARTEIEIVADGQIIDLNRIPLPQDAPIIDNRFPDTSTPNP